MQRAGTPGEAAKEADAVLLAVHWPNRRCAGTGGRFVSQGDRKLLPPDRLGKHETDYWHQLAPQRRAWKRTR